MQSFNYPKMTADTMEMLPFEKQAEVYDFVTFLKTKSRIKAARNKKTSLLNIIGLGRSNKSDISVNHDKYLYEQA
ncbi:MAG: hypothetical protein A2350_00585 [Candidatus Raymondbacteria bacterium RifOxyB12_full_50_8]|nr:MAG: hypothetical protein A2248_04905 [Candidatus Raymondbacteria bacterium RIFOXYA2_FULL_49_16]OGK00677.1 MAG: hypothetical protein A2350_00585 [Candidatus Raymondbacteria bacterium RifOxyB12_full_50_8]OGP43329.1 MAG: hypothetical protein A2324_02545 [Candidatus Raymondbacteria bacterium RIFOXYB2_FULL_49_35]